METLKNQWDNLPLRRFFVLSVGGFVGIAVILSALVVGALSAFRHWLLPDPGAVYLTLEETFSDGTVQDSTYWLNFGDDLSSLPSLYMEYDDTLAENHVVRTRYSVKKIEAGVDSLTPKRKLAYQASGIAMFAAPAVFAFGAIFACGIYFYRKKLKEPLIILQGAAEQISEQNLDFTVAYPVKDEMGELCRSFEDMRKELSDNYKAMWKLLEERRLMQASIAHDLRNPIAIIQGYAEYLENLFQKGEVDSEKACRVVGNLNAASKRLEQYTESIRLLNQSEEEQIFLETKEAFGLAHEMAEDFSLLAKQKNVALDTKNHLPHREIQVDSALLYRVLENVVSNALRFAKDRILLEFFLEGSRLSVIVTDDGGGFSSEFLEQKAKKLFAAPSEGHMGIGLSVSRLLCQKHGGNLELSNVACGACVKISVSV